MERLRIEFGSESPNLLFADSQSTGTEGLAHGEVFEMAAAHSRSSSSYASKPAQRLMPVIADWKNEPSGRANMPWLLPLSQ